MGRKKKRIWETWTDWDHVSAKCDGCATPTDDGHGNQVRDEHDRLHRLCWDCWKRLHVEMQEEIDEVAKLTEAGQPAPPKQGTLF
jgi:hypothetical protein